MKITSFNVKGKNNTVKITLTGKNTNDFWSELEDYIRQNEKFFRDSSFLIDGLPIDFDDSPKKYIEDTYGLSIRLNGGTTNQMQNYLTSSNTTYYHLKTIRSGQRFFYAGDVVVMGNVNSGGEILASGSITITKSVGGLVHAGYNGNKKSFIVAEKLMSPQLRIGDYVSNGDIISERAFISINNEEMVISGFEDANMKGD
ncbi:septum site-determining protein MinC [Proteinivorax tanatarense]|uniref:Probable septum site-determining protein MinC n=1 Tax=Proteinivorax tanatarense TaxID=1260629 RepID=A0AAU7VIG0_9FIRM